MKAELERLRTEQLEWDQAVKHGYMNEQIKLNVGGTPKDFTRGNLCTVKDSLLARFFMKQNIHRLLHASADGRIFIDRDPKYFQLMMNYLANAGVIDKSNWDPLVQDLYQKELDFWGVEQHLAGVFNAGWGNNTFKTIHSSSPKAHSDYSPGAPVAVFNAFNNPNKPLYTIGGSNF